MYEPRIAAYVNEHARTYRCDRRFSGDALHFHRNLPEPYVSSLLIPLSPGLVSHLQLGRVFLKDEGERFETPSFKTFGASWALHRTVCDGIGLPPSTSGEEVIKALEKQPFRITLHTATDGKWGQAVACMADWLLVKARFYVPTTACRDLMRDFFLTGELVKVHGDYNAACKAARNAVCSLNEEAERDSDAERLPMIEAVGWNRGITEHEDDGVQDLSGINAPLAADVQVRIAEIAHDKDDAPHVSVAEVEEVENTTVHDASETADAAESITLVVSEDGIDKASDTIILGRTESAESRTALPSSSHTHVHVDLPISAIHMTPESEVKRVHLLVQDSAFPGYEKFPEYVVEGHMTLMLEIDQDVHKACQKGPDLIIVPVGTGSLAQAVVWYFKCVRRKTCPVIVTVEPESAACLQTSLRNGKRTKIVTGETSMSGMNREEVSSLAWPVLRDGVDIAMTVTDDEVDAAAAILEQDSSDTDFQAEHGPCSASTLAALRKLLPAKHPYRTGGDTDARWLTKPYNLDSDSIAVLVGTESLFCIKVGD